MRQKRNQSVASCEETAISVDSDLTRAYTEVLNTEVLGAPNSHVLKPCI